RVVSRLTLRYLRSRGFNLRHVVLVGAGPFAARVMDTIKQQGGLGLRVHGVVVDDTERHRVGEIFQGVPILGCISEITRVVNEKNADQVLVALPIDGLAPLKSMMASLSRETVDVRVIPDFYQYMTL